MAAGLGFKTFTTGEVLTAADTNGYLMQGVLVFASSAARAAAITSPQEGQYSYLKDTNSTEYYDGAAWIAAPIGDITGVTAGVGISGGGTSGTVTVTNDMATTITASGDIVVGTGSGTYDNLPIGTTGQLLTADTTVSPYKVKWATPAASASGLTLIKRASTSGAVSTGTTFDSVFSSTYKTYQINIEQWYSATRDDDGLFQTRKATVTANSNNYAAANEWTESNTTVNLSVSNASAITITKELGGAGYYRAALTIMITPGGASDVPLGYWNGAAGGSSGMMQPRGAFFTTYHSQPDGFILSTASNMTCTVAVYGLAV